MLIDDLDLATGKPIRKPNGRRVSVIKDDPGFRLFCELTVDRKEITIFLNGEEKKGVMTADEREGFIFGSIITPEGNYALDPYSGEFLYEKLYGDVKLEISDA